MSAADHLKVSRQHGLFNHHGIDLGDGTIAHYLEGREILRSSHEEFTQGSKATLVIHKGASLKKITLKRALSRIGEKDYNILFNNCEHFANWCKTGYHRSSQIENLFNIGKKGSNSIRKLLPKSFLSELDILFPNMIKNKIQSKPLQIIEKLQRELNQNLLAILKNIKEAINDPKYNSKFLEDLILRGQIVADELASIQTIKDEVISLLNQKNNGHVSHYLINDSQEK